MGRLPCGAEVDENQVAAIGFCFGGLCVLDLARVGASLLGVVSFHGLFTAPGNTEGNARERESIGPARVGRPDGDARFSCGIG